MSLSSFQRLKEKFSNYLLAPMLTESQVKDHSPENISGASKPNGVTAFSLTGELDGDSF